MIVKYMKGIDTQRKIWVSARFKDAEKGVYKIIQHVCSLFEGKWYLIPTRAEFIAEYKKATKQKRPNLVLGLEHADDPQDCCPWMGCNYHASFAVSILMHRIICA